MEGGERAKRIFFIRGGSRKAPIFRIRIREVTHALGDWKFRVHFLDCFTSMDEIGGVFPIIVFVTLVEMNMFGVLVTADDLLGEAFTLDTRTHIMLYPRLIWRSILRTMMAGRSAIRRMMGLTRPVRNLNR